MIRSFLTVSVGTLASRLLGFARDAMIAALLGTGPVADAFLIAFQLVNVVRRLLTEGALNAALVPAWLRMRETGGAVAVGGRDRLSMIYFGQSRNGLTLGVQLDVGSRIPIATTAMGRAYIWALPSEERASLLRELREHYGSRWPKMRDGIERAGETVAKLGFAISAGEWQNDVHAVGVALKLNDGTGPYAFNCGAPAFRFTEGRLRNDIGPRLVAMVRNIEAALGGAMPQSKKDDNKKLKAGGKVARMVAGIR